MAGLAAALAKAGIDCEDGTVESNRPGRRHMVAILLENSDINLRYI